MQEAKSARSGSCAFRAGKTDQTGRNPGRPAAEPGYAPADYPVKAGNLSASKASAKAIILDHNGIDSP